jgi:hypothetical protein
MDINRLITICSLLAGVGLLIAVMSGCALTYPGKHGNITLELTPTPEMLDHIGVRIHPVNRDK